MKHILYLLLILVAGCGSKSSNDPASVAKSYLHAINEGDFKKAKSYATKDFVRQLERVEQSVNDNVRQKANVELIDEQYKVIKDMDSIVIVSMEAKAKLKDEDIILVSEAWLIKQDGKWLINEVISKN